MKPIWTFEFFLSGLIRFSGGWQMIILQELKIKSRGGWTIFSVHDQMHKRANVSWVSPDLSDAFFILERSTYPI